MQKPCGLCEQAFDAKGTAKFCPDCRVHANRNRANRCIAKQRENDPEGYLAKRREQSLRWYYADVERSRQIVAKNQKIMIEKDRAAFNAKVRLRRSEEAKAAARERSKKWREENPDKVGKWAKAHPDRVNAYSIKRYRDRKARQTHALLMTMEPDK